MIVSLLLREAGVGVRQIPAVVGVQKQGALLPAQGPRVVGCVVGEEGEDLLEEGGEREGIGLALVLALVLENEREREGEVGHGGPEHGG